MVRFTNHVILGSFPRGHVRSSEVICAQMAPSNPRLSISPREAVLLHGKEHTLATRCILSAVAAKPQTCLTNQALYGLAAGSLINSSNRVR